MHPERRFFPLQQQTTSETAIRTNLLADLYVALGDSDTKGDWTVRAYWKPLVPWIWIGAVIMAFGGMVSLSDRRWRVGAGARASRRRSHPHCQPRRIDHEASGLSAAAALFLVLAGYFVLALRPNHDIHELPSAMIEKPAPAFDLAGLDTAKSLDLNALKGHPVVINFFASWCVPCRIEHPLLMRLAEQNHLPLYGIDYKDKPADATRLLATFGDPYRQVGVDQDGRVGLNFGVYGVPETYVIDSAGIIRKRFVGPLTAETVDNDLLPLLKKLDQS